MTGTQFLTGAAIVAIVIFAFFLAQGIGESVGSGIREYLVR